MIIDIHLKKILELRILKELDKNQVMLVFFFFFFKEKAEFYFNLILLKVPWKARRSNQSILKEINPEYSLEGLMLKLKLQYFGHLMGRANSLEKTLMLGKSEGRRSRGQQRMRWLDGTTNSMDMSWVNSGKLWRTGKWKSGMLQSMWLQRVGHNLATEQQ